MTKHLLRGSLSFPVFLLVLLTFSACKKNKEEEPDGAGNTHPVITSFSPAYGRENTLVIINGEGFSKDAAKNTVLFSNNVKAEVVSATATQLKVKVPAGIATGKLSVSVNGVSAQSSTDFVLGPKAGFSFVATTNTLPGQAKMSFTNHSDNALTYEWEFANGTVATTAVPGDVWYYKTGKFNVQLIARNGNMADTIVKEVSVTTDNSLTAYYMFNGNSNDAVYGQHGTVSNAVLTTDRYNTANSAYSFNGTSSYIRLPDHLIRNTGPATAISLWFQAADPSASGAILGYQNAGVGPAATSTDFVSAVYIGTDKKLHAKLWTGAAVVMTPAEEANTDWHHLVLTGNHSGQSLYIDGVLKGSTSDPVDNSLEMLYNQLGVAYAGGVWPKVPSTPGWFYFKGKIDDVRIYNRLLTGSEVMALFNE